MARQELTAAFAGAIVALLEWTWPSAPPRLREVASRFVDHLVPDPPMRVTTDEGETLSGIMLVDRGRVLIWVGAPRGSRTAPPARRSEDSGIPLWSRGDDLDIEHELGRSADRYRSP